MAWLSAWMSLAGYSDGTIAADPVVRTDGHVASAVLRWKITVRSSGVSISSPVHFSHAARDASRLQAPFGLAILMLRSNDVATSPESRVEPSWKVTPSLSVHW